MALFPLGGSTIKGRVLASFPVSVEGSGGIGVSKSNGVWTVEPDWEDLDAIDSGDIVDTKETWVRDPDTGVYNRVPLSAIVQALGQAGAGISLNFTADLSATADADPGSGKLRFNNADQNAATVIYVDDEDVNGLDVTATIATLDDSTATVKGQLSITKVGDATKRLIFNVTGITDSSGYTDIAVTNIASSATNPFIEGDTLLFGFTRTGDSGSSSGDVTAAATFDTDNVLIRSDGTSKGVQFTGITVADTTNAMSGVGAITSSGKLTATVDDATDTGVTPSAKFSHTTSGTPAAGIGTSIQFETETAAGNNEIGMEIQALTTDVTSTSEDFSFVVKLMAAGAAVAEMVKVTSVGVMTLAGSAAKIVLHAAGGTNLTGGFTATSYNNGTKSSGTFTPDALNGNLQHSVNGGAHTLAPPASVCSMILQIKNTAGAGTITTSGFSKVSGDAFDTTTTSAFECVIRKTNDYSLLTITKIA